MSDADLERYARRVEHEGRAPATVARRLATRVCFYRWGADERVIDHCPALSLRRPRRPEESPRLGLSRTEVADWLDAGEEVGGHAYALACLLALNGLRVGEVCATDVVDLAQGRWHHTLTILGKGDRPAVVPLPPRTVDAVRTAVGDRQAGPLLLTRTGGRMTRGAAARIVTRLAVTAGIDKHLTPDSLRHSVITAALNAGVALRDVQRIRPPSRGPSLTLKDADPTRRDIHPPRDESGFVAAQADTSGRHDYVGCSRVSCKGAHSGQRGSPSTAPY